MPKYGVLCQTNPSYDGALLAELEDLYVGGWKILGNSRKHLRQLVGEGQERFDERCAIVSYQPFLSQIISNFMSALFGQPLDVKPAADASNPDTPGELPEPELYRQFVKNCDRQGGTFLDLMKGVLVTALLNGQAIEHLDAPSAPDDPADAPRTKAEEEALGTDKVYAYEVPVGQLIDWLDGPNGFVWATVRSSDTPRNDPFAERNEVVETFKVWQLVDGLAVWKQYQIKYRVENPPNPNEDVPLVASGETSFKRIPLLRFKLPNALWIGGLIGPQAREHFQRRSSLIGAQNRSLCAIPWVALGSEIGAPGGALPSEKGQDPHRGGDIVGKFASKGYLELGGEDKIGFAEPLGHCYELVDKQLGSLKDAMFSVTSQMAASITGTSSTALGRSGLSKQKDTESTAKVLGELGSKVRQFAALIYRTISEARGEDVIWQAHGLDSYEPEEREQILEEAISLDQVQIPSTTFKKHHKFLTAKRLLGSGTDPVTLDQIKSEIEKGVEEEVEMAGLMKEAQQAQVEAATEAAKNPASALGPKPVTPPQNPTVLGMQHPAPAAGGTNAIAGATGGPVAGGQPEPGGATKDGKVGSSKAAKDAGMVNTTGGALHAASVMMTGAKPMGPAGQPLLPDNAHHQTGQHVDANLVFKTISGDYKDKDIQWIYHCAWVGPVEVPLGSIDFSNKDNWQASEDIDHVQHFVDMLEDGEQLKPVILVNNPSQDAKFLVVDGHHRSLACLQKGIPVVAYVGQVGSDTGPWDTLHDGQDGSSKQKSSQQSSSKQKSQQSNQRSQQK